MTEEERYLAWVRQQPCAHCGAMAPSHPHHHTSGGRAPFEEYEFARTMGHFLPTRGKAQKSHDSWAFPLCFRSHRQFHDASGPFRDWTRDQRSGWQTEQVRLHRKLWADVNDPGVF